MSKVDFIKEFNELVIFEPRIEYGLKITSDSINVDRVNIGFKKQDITKEDLINVTNVLFDNTDETNMFTERIYNEREEDIQQIFLGYSNGSTEIYFECYKPGESSYCISYNSSDKKQNEYYPLDNHTKLANDIADIIREKTNLIIPDPSEIFKGGFVREGNIYYILVLEPMSKIGGILKSLCYIINNNESKVIDEWFDEHKDKIVSNIAYTIKNNQLILNIYVNESTGTN